MSQFASDRTRQGVRPGCRTAVAGRVLGGHGRDDHVRPGLRHALDNGAAAVAVRDSLSGAGAGGVARLAHFRFQGSIGWLG